MDKGSADKASAVKADLEVERLRQEIEGIRQRVVENVSELRTRIKLKMLVEKAVELVAEQAGTVVGKSLNVFKFLLPKSKATPVK